MIAVLIAIIGLVFALSLVDGKRLAVIAFIIYIYLLGFSHGQQNKGVDEGKPLVGFVNR